MPSDTGEGGRLRVITDVLRSFADATNDYDRLLKAIVGGVSGVVGLPCTIRLLTAEGATLETVALHDPSNDELLRALTGRVLPLTPELKVALAADRAFVQKVHTVDSVEAAHAGMSEKLALREVLIAPLQARGKALGLLFVPRRGNGDDTFAEADVDLVDALASHAALAIANSRLLTSLETLERARMHERSILDTVTAPLLLIGRDGVIIDANRAFIGAFGFDDVVGRSLPALLPKMSELLGELPPAGAGLEGVEVELPTQNGVRTFLARTKKTYRPGNGSHTTLITLVDLTDRKLAEAGTRRRALLVSSMSEALVGLDTKDIIIEWNPAAERLFGWTAADALGRPVGEVFAEYRGPNTRKDNRRILATGATIKSETQIKNKRGEWVDVEYSMMPLVDRGETTGFVTVMLDVTRRNRLDADLRARIDDLTQANAELESFSYSVSHDLRAPVRAIDGFSEILEEEHAQALDEEGRRMLGLVRKNAKRMGLLIDDILALSRYSRQPLVTQRIDCDALARSTLDEATRAEPARKISATFTSPLPPVHGDESLLRQVWLNLFTNAVKYTRGRDEARIEIGGLEQDSEVVYTVKDNGAGFDMRYADKLFGVFERLHSMKEFEGTGIGLALVAKILKRHGGRVWGEGEVGKGATFHFALPIDRRRKESP